MHFASYLFSAYLFAGVLTNARPVQEGSGVELLPRGPVAPAAKKPVQAPPIRAPEVLPAAAAKKQAPPIRAPAVLPAAAAKKQAPPIRAPAVLPAVRPAAAPANVPKSSVPQSACLLPTRGRNGKIRKRTISTTNAPNKLTIILNGQSYAMTKNCAQGLTGICYRLDDGRGFAKANAAGQSLKSEIEATRLVGLLLDSGTDTGCTAGAASGSEWLIVRKASGQNLNQHPGFAQFKKTVTKEQCQAKTEVLATLAFDKAEAISASVGILHKDIHPENVLFADNLNFAALTEATVSAHLNDVTLIDWSSVRTGTGLKISKIQRTGLAALFKACA